MPHSALQERHDVAMVYVLIRPGAAARCRERVAAGFALAEPSRGALSAARRAVAGDAFFAWAGPDRWLAVATGIEPAAWLAKLESVLGGDAALSQQSSGQKLVRVSGPASRDMLAKLCPLDLHPAAFGPDAVALTRLGHIAVLLWRVGESDAFEIAIPRSYARSAWEELLAHEAAADRHLATQGELSG